MKLNGNDELLASTSPSDRGGNSEITSAALTNDSLFEGKEELHIHSDKIEVDIKTGIDDIHTDNHNQAFDITAIVDDDSNANVFVDDH